MQVYYKPFTVGKVCDCVSQLVTTSFFLADKDNFGLFCGKSKSLTYDQKCYS